MAPLKNPLPPPSLIKLSSTDSDSDDDGVVINKTRVFNGEAPFKKPKLEDDILPMGFLDPLPMAIEAPPISVLPPLPPPPVPSPEAVRSCKQFWKAGDYAGQVGGDSSPVLAGMDHVRVHPKFLHSNATSHKWALGALAELLDNSVDEVCHGATFVNIDMLKNTKDGTKMLLIEDDGGGMDPGKIRQCMSLGYSDKSKSANTIGQYGNGFKTSTMRLGADVIMFSRCHGKKGRSSTQSIGLLSYTYLTNTGKEDIVVPMIDYVKEGEIWTRLTRSSSDVWKNNLETILQWSPYYSEDDILQQFNFMTDQGTRLVIYNLWDDDQGELELDFEADQHDIQIRGTNRDEKKIQMSKLFPNSRHFLTYRHSLRSYASILYLRLPHGFRMILRGKEIEHHSSVNDMMLKQEVTYRPHPGPDGVPKDPSMVAVVTIGFVKDAKDHIDVQGFNVYHKNRLIKPFWRVWNAAGSDGRGVIGVLEANFIEPAHDKQGFERTTVLSRLEARLLQMQKTYWTTNCHKIGYAPRRKSINGSLDKDSSSEASKSLSPDISKTCKTHGSSGYQNSCNSSLLSNQKMAESTASRSLGGAGKHDKDVQFTKDQSGSEPTGSPTQGAPSCGSTGAQLAARSNLKATDAICNGKGPVTENSLQQLNYENKTLRNGLNELEKTMLRDLQYERERNKVLTEEVAAMEEKLEVLNKEQEALITIFQEERARREENEESLRKKLKDASATIQELNGKLHREAKAI